MRTTMSLMAAGAALALVVGCAPTDDERCGSGFVWQENTCFEEDGTDSDTGPAGDGGADGGGELPTGLGETCTDEGGECDAYEADYCAIQPGGDTGYCTVLGCSASPDNCPGEYLCCDFPDGFDIDNFCVTEADLELMGSMCQG